MLAVEVDVLPAQTQDLAPAEAEDQDQDAGGVEPMSPHRTKEVDRLARGQGFLSRLVTFGMSTSSATLLVSSSSNRARFRAFRRYPEHLEAGRGRHPLACSNVVMNARI